MPYPKRIDEAAITDQALELIRSQGREALSMRTLAAALEVQASSLYRYFEHREALEGAVAERVAAQLEERMRRAAKGKDAPGAFRALSKEYVRFAREEPAIFDLLMAGGGAPRPAGKSLWNFILQTVGGVTGDPDDTAAAVAVWSMLHGFVVLERSGAFGASGPKRGLETGVAALLVGLQKA